VPNVFVSIFQARNYKNLPDPEGPLSDVLPSSTIKAANDAVLAVSQQPKRVVVKRLLNNGMSR